MSTHIYGSSTVRFAGLKAELLSPIKDACHVCVVCVRAFACAALALRIISSKQEHEVLTNMLHTRMHTHAPKSSVIHQS